jgi:hypothetical protein
VSAARSLRPEVRNPLLALPEFAELRALLHGTEPIAPREFAKKFDAALKALRLKCTDNAQNAWRKNKPPMASYWKCTGVWLYHTRRALR